MAIARKAVESIFILINATFLILEKIKVIFHMPKTLIKNNIQWIYLMKNVMGFPCLDTSSSASCSVQDEGDIWNHFQTKVRYKKLLWSKYEFISAMKDISFLSRKCEIY